MGYINLRDSIRIPQQCSLLSLGAGCHESVFAGLDISPLRHSRLSFPITVCSTMISTTTLMLATLVFNAAMGFAAPIRIPTVPDVAVRAVVADPVPPRAEVVDAQPLRKRSADGYANRPRLAREVEPEVDARDTASSESVSLRDSLPEIEEIVARRFPRRALYDRALAQRSPEPSPIPPSDPALASRSPAPDVARRFPRRALYDRHVERSAPAPPEARSADNPELLEKRSAPITDNLPREPEPVPAPAPPAPEVRRRVYPRRILAEKYEKRQETSPTDEQLGSTPVVPSDASTSSPTPVAPAAPFDLNKVIADAVGTGSSETVKHDQGHKITSSKGTTITIKIEQSLNSDVKLDPPSATTPSPTLPSSDPPAETTPTPEEPTLTPEEPTATPEEPTPTPEEPTSNPEEPTSGTPDNTTEETPGDQVTEDGTQSGNEARAHHDDATIGSTTGSHPAGNTADVKRDLDNANAAVEPVTKRSLGISGALLAS